MIPQFSPNGWEDNRRLGPWSYTASLEDWPVASHPGGFGLVRYCLSYCSVVMTSWRRLHFIEILYLTLLFDCSLAYSFRGWVHEYQEAWRQAGRQACRCGSSWELIFLPTSSRQREWNWAKRARESIAKAFETSKPTLKDTYQGLLILSK